MNSSSSESKKLKLLQLGTGWHIDCNGYNPYFEEQDSAGLLPVKPLKFYRPIQALIALSDQVVENGIRVEYDGGLDVVPGFHVFCEKYFEFQGRFKNGKSGPVLGRNLHRWGKYVTKFSSINKDILKSCIHVGRIPDDWDPLKLETLKERDFESMKSNEDIANYISLLKEELKEMKPLKKGDYVLWDNKVPHRNSERNETEVTRRVMYHTMMPRNISETEKFLKEQRDRRNEKTHPEMFEKTWQFCERGDFGKGKSKVLVGGKKDSMSGKGVNLSGFGKRLWGYEKFEEDSESQEKRRKAIEEKFKLDQRYIEFYKRYGFVVIPEALEEAEVEKVNRKVDEYIQNTSGIDLNKLEESLTSQKWKKITGSFGGMLNVFYLKEMEEIRSRFEFYAIISQVLKSTYSSSVNPNFKHPLGPFDETNLCLFPDRMNYRFPCSILEKLAKKENGGKPQVGKKRKREKEERDEDDDEDSGSE